MGVDVEDEGDFEAYDPAGEGNGGEVDEGDDGYGVVRELELESGVGVDVMGKERVYRELWALREVEGVLGDRVCVVLRTMEEVEGEVRGVVVRIGGFVHGLVKRRDGKLEVGRWRLELEGRWKMIVGVGLGIGGEEGGMKEACEAAMEFEQKKLEEGEVYALSGLKWKVEEVTIW